MALLTYLEKNKLEIARALLLIRTRPTHCNAREFVHRVAEYCISRVFDGKMDGIEVGVYLGMGMDLSGKTYAQGIKGMDVCVRLNGFFVNLFTARPSVSGRDHLVAMILHHLIHAYFLVVCGRPVPGSKESEGILGHGKNFAAILYKIKQVSALVGGAPLPIRFGHLRPSLGGHPLGRRPRDGLSDLFDGHLQATFQGDERNFCTQCAADVTEIPETDIQTWVEKDCRKSVDPDIFELCNNGEFEGKPQSKRGDKDKYVLFKWLKKLYMIPRSAFSNVPALKDCFKDSSPLEVSDAVSEAHFKEFLTFCKTGNYGQPLTATQVKDGKAPPLIKEHKAIPLWPTFLVTDIEMFKLGVELGLEELRLVALDRMSVQHITHEEPRNILRAIFEPHTTRNPYPALVEWAASWFRRTDKVKVATKPIDSTNWAIINKTFSSALYNSPLSRSPLLAAELIRAGDELALLPIKEPSAPPPVSELFGPLIWQQPHVYGLPAPPPPPGLSSGIPFDPYFPPHPPPPSHHLLGQDPPGWDWGPVRKVGDKIWESVVPGTAVRAVWKDGKWMPVPLGLGQAHHGPVWAPPTGLPPPPPPGHGWT
jgi:hypothetical protein